MGPGYSKCHTYVTSCRLLEQPPHLHASVANSPLPPELDADELMRAHLAASKVVHEAHSLENLGFSFNSDPFASCPICANVPGRTLQDGQSASVNAMFVCENVSLTSCSQSWQ